MKPDTSADWRPRQIIAALDAKGWTCRKLAEHHGVAYTTIADALRKPYPISEKRIADALNLHPKKIWPSRYHANGTSKARLRGPYKPGRKRKSTYELDAVKVNKSQKSGPNHDSRPGPAHETTNAAAGG